MIDRRVVDGSRTADEAWRAPERRLVRVAVAGLLFASVLTAYAPVLQHGFVLWDDDAYVTGNPVVLRGASLEGLSWALTARHASNWHPLTWLSHMLDVAWFGMNAAGHHATSVLLHAVNTLLLFGLLARTTRRTGRAALVAGLFALHPLHVESVAWVAERKDVLSTAFWLAALHAWVAWTRGPTPARYAAVVALFCCGLASKPMVVTLPVTLLLLDVWPLGRLERLRDLPRSLAEKAPLFLLSIVVATVALVAQRAGGSLASDLVRPLDRLANAVVSLGWYVWKTVWPTDLCVFYPHPDLAGGTPWTTGQIALSVAAVALLTTGALVSRRRWLAMGWMWFVATLLPVLGLVQVGEQARADRYTYVPLIGLFLACVWGCGELADRVRLPATLRGVAAVVLLVVAGLSATRQAGYWRDSETLFRRALAVAPRSPAILDQLGTVLMRSGRIDEAVEQFRRGLEILPENARSWNNLGNALAMSGRLDEAVSSYERSLSLRPDAPGTLNNLGSALTRLGRPAEALVPLERALRSEPGSPVVHRSLGNALAALGRDVEAAEQYREAARLEQLSRPGTKAPEGS